MLDQEKGILKVFLSFPLRDIKGSKEKLLNRLLSAFESTALELFISKGDGSQKTLEEVRTCDIAIFLISPYCETRISHCEFTETCKAECEIKRGEGKISYSWCEFRIALSENKPYLIYIIDEGCEADNNLKLWKTGESEKEYSQIGYDSVKKFMDDLARNITEWYSEGKINLRRFCGRRDLLKKLFNKMNKSVEVYGVGGIGKTTLCEAALLIYTLLGREVFYIGGEEGYASGSGYEYGSQIVRHHFPDVTIDDILDVLNFAEDFKKVDEKMKINAILNFLEREDAILYIDNLRENETLKELVRRGNGLRRGCILVSLKRELSIAFYRLPVESIEREERDSLVELMASRMGKVIEKREKMRIAEIGEGHPIATYLLVSNLGRGNIVDLESFKEGLDFSRDDDVREYMDRVVRSSISSEAYNLLKDLSIIEEEIDMKSINESFPISTLRSAFTELLDTSILERKGNKAVWQYNQIRGAVFDDLPERHGLAATYYKRKFERYGETKDEIEMLYHAAKIKYTNGILERFLELSSSIEKVDAVYRLLPKVGEEIRIHVSGKERAIVSRRLGRIYNIISHYIETTQNSKKAIKTCKEALKVFTLKDFPEDYGRTQKYLGFAYTILAEEENRGENCRKAIKACKEALKVFTLKDFPEDYAYTQDMLGVVYYKLAEVRYTSENCRKAIRACEEALKIYTLEDFPEDYADTLNTLGVAYYRLAKVEDTTENCRKAIEACEKALLVFNFENDPLGFAATQINLGIAYRILAKIENTAKNCRKAINAFEEALKVYTLENFQIKYAKAQNNLGRAYTVLAEVEDPAENSKKAIKACKETSEIYTLEDLPIKYAMIQGNLGDAYRILAQTGNTIDNCKKAINAFEEALKVYTLEDLPIDHSWIQYSMGKVYAVLSEVENPAGNCRKAINAFEEVLRVCPLEDFPFGYAETQNDLGKVYTKLSKVEDTTENSRKAIIAYKEALKVFRKEKYPERYHSIKENLFEAIS